MSPRNTSLLLLKPADRPCQHTLSALSISFDMHACSQLPSPKNNKRHFDCIIALASMPELSNLKLFNCPIIIIVKKADNIPTIRKQLNCPCDFIYEDKINESSLTRAINNLVERHQLRKALTEEKKKVSLLAHRDILTDLPNRTHFDQLLEKSIARGKRYKYNVAVVILNIDSFKNINESLGYTAGDLLLKEFADRISKTLRQNDTISRIGSDEFAIIIEQLKDKKEIDIVINKMIKHVEEAFVINHSTIYITACAGVATYPLCGRSVPELFRNAYAALNQAKDKGKRNVYVYKPTESIGKFKKINLELALRQAINRDELSVYYQPKLDLQEYRIHGFEALLRWNHPKLGFVPPNKFIPFAELSGLITELGEWVLYKACEECMAWGESGFGDIKIAVNLSALQLERSNFIQTLANSLKHTKLPANLLELELTETTIMKNLNNFKKSLNTIHDMGVDISIDDFGTGYSSLNYLKHFPVNTLKIDRSFVTDIAEDVSGAAIVKAIIALGHSLDLQVLAEGVEKECQLSKLNEFSCDSVQGFYFSEPLPREAITQTINTMNAIKSL